MPIQYKIVAAINSSGKIEAFYVTGLTQMINNKGEQTDDLLFTGFYIFSQSAKKMSRELYYSALILAQEESKRLEKKIAVAVGDVTETVVQPWEDVGRKRVFVVSGKKVKEFPYIQPSLTTSESSEGGVSEHLMPDLFTGKEMDKKFLKSIIRTLYWWSFQQMKFSGSEPKELEAYRARLDSWMLEYDAIFSGPSKIMLLNADDIKRKEREGYIFS